MSCWLGPISATARTAKICIVAKSQLSVIKDTDGAESHNGARIISVLACKNDSRVAGGTMIP
eukprot:scaffold651375_cov32-Prasinocladus_malaysianus.AAC.1